MSKGENKMDLPVVSFEEIKRKARKAFMNGERDCPFQWNSRAYQTWNDEYQRLVQQHHEFMAVTRSLPAEQSRVSY